MIKISRGPSTRPTELVDLLLECHERIRRFVGFARSVGARSDLPDDEVSDACSRVERYFTEALPLHVADEEASILPRLRGREAELDRALQTMEQQHSLHEPMLRALLQSLAAVRLSPSDAALRPPLAAAAAELEREFGEHLELEESIVFPAIRRLLTASEQAAVLAELRRRRAPG